MEMPQIYRPIPRRGFEITPASADSSHPPSPATEPIGQEQNSSHRVDTMPSRTRSILNLTSSTLLGIYSPIGSDAGREESSTPWGTGAQTPTQRGSVDHTPQLSPLTWTGDSAKPVLPQKRKGLRGFILPLFLQTMLLFGSGIGYGSLITHLHRTQHITPIPVPHIERNTLYYQLSWGVFGILLGNALPIVDSLWETTISPAINGGRATQRSTSGATKASNHDSTNANSAPDSGLGPMWYSAVRSIGVFVGIAFAMVWFQSLRACPFVLTCCLDSVVFPGSQRYKLL
ncbi:hypothetical protein EDD36DRAFT_418025 [Exophiala viscosa]|uniref:Uncharacterized protein n=1 Tax=Exophiala viscosa TaxID=2486360 RepID=A0AAN6E098_9EURO|nr:hypothetical protein EDD36DRAFT_418025 [Exophiala viscosa]